MESQAKNPEFKNNPFNKESFFLSVFYQIIVYIHSIWASIPENPSLGFAHNKDAD